MLGTTLGGSPLLVLALLVAVAFAAGFVGGMFGIGGGLFLVPSLVLLFGLEVHLAIAASLVGVVATSTGAAGSRVSEGFVNLRLGMFLETATVVGGLVGALIAVTVLARQDDLLILTLVPVLLLSAYLLTLGRPREMNRSRPSDPVAIRWKLGGTYRDPASGEVETYEVRGTRVGLAFATLAGLGSGLLGIGGGIFKVPAMNSFMNVPLRVAAATSTVMIGVTASAGALVYLFAGDVALVLVAPVALSVASGSFVATHVGRSWQRTRLRFALVGLLLLAALLLVLRATGGLA